MLIDLPDGLFAGAYSLSTLLLSGNALTELRVNMFSNLTSLYTLAVAANRIETVEVGLFDTILLTNASFPPALILDMSDNPSVCRLGWQPALQGVSNSSGNSSNSSSSSSGSRYSNSKSLIYCVCSSSTVAVSTAAASSLAPGVAAAKIAISNACIPPGQLGILTLPSVITSSPVEINTPAYMNTSNIINSNSNSSSSSNDNDTRE
jgi:hypothetical protein